MRPTELTSAIGLTYNTYDLEAAVVQRLKYSKGIGDRVEECAKAGRELAASFTRIPFAVIKHAIINRNNNKWDGQPGMTVHETTLEL